MGPDAHGEPGGVRASSLNRPSLSPLPVEGWSLVAQKRLYPTSPAWVPAGLSTRADPAPGPQPLESRDGLQDQKAVRTGGAHAPLQPKGPVQGRWPGSPWDPGSPRDTEFMRALEAANPPTPPLLRFGLCTQRDDTGPRVPGALAV